MKINKDNRGFSLTEVMIGIMILAVAIVSVSNLLITVIGTNRQSVSTLQAYYLAQEGIEAVRNIRDSNWLHGKNWLGEDSSEIWGGRLQENVRIDLSENGWVLSPFSTSMSSSSGFSELAGYAPWVVTEVANETLFNEMSYVNGESSGFKRVITVEPYNENGCEEENCVLVTSTVFGGFSEDITLKTILTDWKNGLL